MVDSPLVQKLLALREQGELASGEDLMEVALTSASVDFNEVELGRLNWSPRENWVDKNGGLPKYIEDVSIGIMKGTGRPREQAIPIAINRIKRWAAGLDNVKPDTVAKALAALAQWEKMKAQAAAKRARRK